MLNSKSDEKCSEKPFEKHRKNVPTNIQPITLTQVGITTHSPNVTFAVQKYNNMQKALSLIGFWKEGKQPYHETKELNELLEQGWKIVSATSTHVSSGGNVYSSYVAPILVIVEKE